jgi:hypothetical protein
MILERLSSAIAHNSGARNVSHFSRQPSPVWGCQQKQAKHIS